MSGGFPRWLRNLLWSDRDNELDAFGGVNFSVDKDWIAGIQYVAFISPPGNFKTEHNLAGASVFANTQVSDSA